MLIAGSGVPNNLLHLDGELKKQTNKTKQNKTKNNKQRRKNKQQQQNNRCAIQVSLGELLSNNVWKWTFNGWQLAKMKKSIPDMSLPRNL